MEYFWWLYLATRLDSLKHFFGWMTFLGIVMLGVTIIIFLIMLLDTSGEESVKTAMEMWDKWIKPWRNRALAVAIGFGSLCAITPSKKDAMFIAAGVGVVEGAKALQGSVIAQKSAQVIEEWLNVQLMDLKSQQKEKEGGK